jgi:hypothetical protein
MTKTIWILGILAVLIIAFFMFASFRFSNIETPAYRVIKTLGQVELRAYPQMTVAQTDLRSSSFDNEGSNGFRTVASYIFGGNQTGDKIAMTAPVIMEMGDSANLSFVMPSAYSLNDLPQPNSQAVALREQPERTLAVIGYGGFSDDEKIQKYGDKLMAELEAQGIPTKGSLMYMGYNSPWDVVNRRNEVAIEVILP